MTGRLWYPQLDVYDAIRRIGGLLVLWNISSPPSPERLYIADFYLANPPLLHRTHMSRELRNKFYALNVRRPEKSFVSYPSAPILFQKMGEVQKQGLSTLTGKGLIDLTNLEKGFVAPSTSGKEIFDNQFIPLFGEDERALASFLAGSFAQSDVEIGTLRNGTGLRRISR